MQIEIKATSSSVETMLVILNELIETCMDLSPSDLNEEFKAVYRKPDDYPADYVIYISNR